MQDCSAHASPEFARSTPSADLPGASAAAACGSASTHPPPHHDHSVRLPPAGDCLPGLPSASPLRAKLPTASPRLRSVQERKVSAVPLPLESKKCGLTFPSRNNTSSDRPRWNKSRFTCDEVAAANPFGKNATYESVCAWFSTKQFGCWRKSDERLAPVSNEWENAKDNFGSTQQGSSPFMATCRAALA